MDYEPLFSKYNTILQNDLKGSTVMNYVSSHDDSYPFDKKREKTFESATKLVLTPGISQVYYGDESARSLDIEGTQGDATLRSFMNWDDIANNPKTIKLLAHWQKLGLFRKNHPAIGAGNHTQLSAKPYIFSRTFSQDNFNDKVIVGLDLPIGTKEITVSNVFANGTQLKDVYSSKTATVSNGKVSITSEFDLVLLEIKK
jgi:alpha-amylase